MEYYISIRSWMENLQHNA